MDKSRPAILDSNTNFRLMVELNKIMMAYPHLTPVVSQMMIKVESEEKSFSNWFINQYLTTFVEFGIAY
jgi:hypothetical protein